MPGRVEGKVAVVTGSTGGVGEAIARGLAREGAAVVVTGRRQEEGLRVAQSIAADGGRALYHQADLTEAADCEPLIAAAVRAFGGLDVLVNCGAELAYHPFDALTPEEFDRAFAANVRAPVFLSRAAIPLMRARGGGSIVNIGTAQAYRGSLDRIAYASSKGALLTATKAMAGALLRDQIRVNWVVVGWVASPQEIALRNVTHGDGAAWLREMEARRPIGRHETPEDIAAAVLFLASDESPHVTGCELNVSGGLYM